MKLSSRRRQVLRRTRGVYDVVRLKDNIFRFLGFNQEEAAYLRALSQLSIARSSRLTREMGQE